MLLSTYETMQVKIGAAVINSSKCQKLLGVKIDNRLTFNEYIRSTCKKASAQLNALNRLAEDMCP